MQLLLEAGRSQLSSKEESYCFLPGKPEQAASALSPPSPRTHTSLCIAPLGWPVS